MSETFYVTYCTGCENVMELQSVTDEWLDGKAISGRHVCSHCGKSYGVWIDGGTIDLGVVKEGIHQNVNDFEVFTEEPWRT